MPSYRATRAIRAMENNLRIHGVFKTQYAFFVSTYDQKMLWLERESGFGRSHYRLKKVILISTSRFGVGQTSGSNCTPLGLHRIAAKHGDGYPVGTIFKNRQPIGYQWKGLKWTAIAHRILRLDGIEPGFNKGGKVDSFNRYIYIHGLGDEPSLGRPASCGCIHLSSSDLIPLFNRVPIGTLVWIVTVPI